MKSISRELLARMLGGPLLPSDIAVWRVVLEVAVRSVDADEGSLLIVDKDGAALDFALTWSRTPGRDNESLIGQRVPIGQGLTGLAAQTQQIQFGATEFAGLSYGENAPAPQAVIAAPMLVDERTIGVITAVRQSDRQFSFEEGDLVGKIAALAGMVVWLKTENKHLEAVPGAGDNPILDPTKTALLASVSRIYDKAEGNTEAILALISAVESLACGRR